MKIQLFTLVAGTLIFLLPMQIAAQMGWKIVNQPPVKQDYYNISEIHNQSVWAVGSAGFIMFSSDNGIHWEEQYKTQNFPLHGCFFINENEGWVCGWNHVLHTEDSGDNWEPQSLPNPIGVGANDIFFINPDTGWIVGDYRTVYRTNNGGQLWESQNGPVQTNHKCLEDVFFIDENNGCAVGGWMLEDSGFVMVTSNGGLNWDEIEVTNSRRMESMCFLTNGQVWSCGQDGYLYSSFNSGYSWTSQYFQTGPSFSDLHFFNDQHAVMTSSNKCFFTTDAWSSYESYFTGSDVSKFSFNPDGTGIGVGNGGDISITNDGGQTWQNMLPFFNEICFFDINNGWATNSPSQDLFHSTDGGITWELFDTPNSGNIYDIYFLDTNIAFAYGSSDELIRTIDAGENWTIVGYLPDTVNIAEIFFISTQVGFISGLNGFFAKTNDGGLTWNGQIVADVYSINDIFFLNENEGWAISYSGNIFHTIDGAATWEEQTLDYSLLDVFFMNSNNGFIISAIDLYITSDGGDSWEIVEDFGIGLSEIIFTDGLNGWIIDKNKVYHTADGGINWIVEAEIEEYGLEDIFMLDNTKGWLCSSYYGYVYSYTLEVGLDQLDEQNEVILFPNPGHDHISIAAHHHNLIFDLFSTEGYRIFSKKIETQDKINTSNLLKGIYIYKIYNSNGETVVTGKWIKN